MFDLDQISINFIKGVQESNSYKLVTSVPDLFLEANFFMADNGNYELSFTLPAEHLNKGVNMDYFFKHPVILLAPTGQTLLVQNTDIIEATSTINTPRKFNIQFKAFRGDINNDTLWRQSKQSAYIKFDRNIFQPYRLGVKFDLTTDKESGDRGYFNAIRLNVDDVDLAFYHQDIGNSNSYYIFRPNGLIDYTKFRNIVDCTTLAFGMLSGFYMADSIYFISVKSKDKKDVTFRYENIGQAINSHSPIIPCRIQNISGDRLNLTIAQFNNFVNLLYQHEDLKRAAMLLIYVGKETGCAKATLGAVALEAITSVLGKKLPAQIVIDDKQVFNSLKYELLKVLKKFKDRISTGQFDLLKGRIDVINNSPNADKYIDVFTNLGIELDEEEIHCLKSRNHFLHGKLPKKGKYDNLSENESLDIVSNRIVMLSSMMLLRKAGYTGYVIDKGMTDVVKWRMMRRGENTGGDQCLREIIGTREQYD